MVPNSPDDGMPAPGEKHWPELKNSWTINQAAGEAHAKVSVRNLQTIIQVGRDAWGREGKVQPVLISATVSLRKPFEDASVQDTVNATTVHYGILSKAILEAVQDFHGKKGVSSREGRTSAVKALLDHVAGHLTSYSLDGAPNSNPLALKNHTPLLDRKLISSLDLTITLSKGLLNSTTGVSRCGTLVFKFLDPSFNHEEISDSYASSLILHEFRVSTLIGVNSNERLAKQLVIARIEVDEWVTERDVYNELEEVVFKTIEESSFQTLESLASHVGWRIIRYIIGPTRTHDRKNFVHKPDLGFEDEFSPRPRIKIRLEKPTAVTLADAPVVELLIDSAFALRGLEQGKALPFPLQGRLDDWIESNDPEGLKYDPVLGSGRAK